ncbi:hypothetical protein CBR_g40794 [Chara braunii]|uniref:Mannose-P-dolichol utilization defect 1 protein homolog n=1 Tax=Chara braunii TaxID=69332 RepID=A0A388LUP3_CHABU|nr:hypothetical protein CBR_g40794 [Chara braunii]|eukprot:GBG85981.1 hypothetical protein CBR_g40794 [Chara braunii]
MDDFKCVIDSLRQMQMTETECYLNALSKLLGYMIVVFSAVVKLPQILVILRNNSIKGLSVASFELETVGFTIALSYILTKNLPFSAYGELVFLLIQALGLNVLIYSYLPSLPPSTIVKGALYSLIAPTILAGRLDPVSFEILYASSHVIFIGSRLPQIWENYNSKSTGQLSFLTSFMNTGGCLVRTFTTIQEKGPISMVMGSVFGIITNGILLLQIIVYSRAQRREEEVKKKKK